MIKSGWNYKLEEALKRITRDYLILFLISGIIVGLDQWTKWIIRTNLAVGEMWMPLDWLAPYARIVHWYNTGVAFGLFQGQGQIFTVLALVVAAVILYYYPRIPDNDWVLRIALGMQLAGALGNLVDRLTVGHVTDFISVGEFPVFNVADSSITVGVGILLLGMWFQDRREKQAARAEEEHKNVEQSLPPNPPEAEISSEKNIEVQA
jgi:signal peptidase II